MRHIDKWFIAFLIFLGITFLSLYVEASKPCKTPKATKPDPRILQHDGFENATWNCQYIGIDAKTHYPTFFCTSKINGAHIQVTFLDEGKKK